VKSVTLTAHGDELEMREKAVEDGGGGGNIKKRRPVLVGRLVVMTVGGGLVPAHKDLEEVFGGGSTKLLHSEVLDNEKIESRYPAKEIDLALFTRFAVQYPDPLTLGLQNPHVPLCRLVAVGVTVVSSVPVFLSLKRGNGNGLQLAAGTSRNKTSGPSIIEIPLTRTLTWSNTLPRSRSSSRGS